MSLTVVPTTSANLEAVWKMYVHYFGIEAIGDLEAYRVSILHPYNCWAVAESGVVGGFSLFRLQPAFLEGILAGRLFERQLTPEDVLPLEHTLPLTLYLSTMAVAPNLSESQRQYYSSRIMAAGAAVLLALHKLGYQIEMIYAYACTTDGKRATRRLGFHPLNGASWDDPAVPCAGHVDERGLQILQRISHLAPPLQLPSPICSFVTSTSSVSRSIYR